MEFLRGIGLKLRSANDSLATAHKSWRDDRLAEREESADARERLIAEREAEVSARLAEIRRLEQGRLRRKFIYIASMAAVVVPAYLFGAHTGSPADSSFAAATISAAPARTTKDEAPASGSDISLPAEEEPSTGTVTQEELGVNACTQRGIAYFKEIGSFPSLSTGEDAATTAFERCNRTTTAFGTD